MVKRLLSISGTVSADTHVCTFATAVTGHLIAGLKLSATGALQPSDIKLIEHWLVGRLLHLYSNLQFSQSNLFLERDRWLRWLWYRSLIGIIGVQSFETIEFFALFSLLSD